MAKENKTKKIISFILLVSIILPTALLSAPEITHAQDASSLGSVPAEQAALTAEATTASGSQGIGTPFYSTLNVGLTAEIAAIAATNSAVDAANAAAAAPPHHSWIEKLLLGFNAASSGATMGFTGTSSAIAVKKFAWDILQQVIRSVEKALLRQLTQSTVNWINSGFHGSPLFVQDSGSFFGNIGKSAIISMVNMTGYNSTNYPFGKAWDLNVINSFRNASNNDAQMSLGAVMNDPTMLSNFGTSGWNGFLNRTQYPQNNVMGYDILANQMLARQLQGVVQTPVKKVQNMLQQGLGFLSPTTCPSNPSYNNGINEFSPPTFKPTVPAPAAVTCANANEETGCGAEANAQATANVTAYNNAVLVQQNAFLASSTCPGGLKATTPGSVVANQITTAMGSTFRQSELGAALGNSIGAILDTLMNHFIQKGLIGMSNAVSSMPNLNNWSYMGQTLSSTTTSTNTLVVPQSVTVKIGTTTPPATISGGTPPYSIVPDSYAPDPTIATAKIGADGVSLTATGISAGQTSFVVEDSSSPVQLATVQVTSSATGTLIADFDNPLALQNVSTNIGTDINNPGGTTITMQGGTPPYSISAQPDSSLALALISSDTTLSIVGNAPGNTSVSLVDSSTPAQTITLQITIGSSESTLSADPSSVPAKNDGSTTNVTISGGTPPYTIATQPDSATANAVISGNTLSIIGSGTGATSVIIQDSFSPAQTITIPITNTPTPAGSTGNCTISGTTISETQADCTSVGGTWSAAGTSASGNQILPLSAGSQNISIPAGDNTVTMISGGQTPYSIATQPDSKIATTTFSSYNNLTINGITSGATSVVVQDASSQTVTIKLNVTPN